MPTVSVAASTRRDQRTMSSKPCHIKAQKRSAGLVRHSSFFCWSVLDLWLTDAGRHHRRAILTNLSIVNLTIIAHDLGFSGRPSRQTFCRVVSASWCSTLRAPQRTRGSSHASILDGTDSWRSDPGNSCTWPGHYVHRHERSGKSATRLSRQRSDSKRSSGALL